MVEVSRVRGYRHVAMIKAKGGGTMDEFLSKLKNLDAYPKINEDFYQRTLSGGIITVASTIIMLLLFLSEFRKSSIYFQ